MKKSVGVRKGGRNMREEDEENEFADAFAVPKKASRIEKIDLIAPEMEMKQNCETRNLTLTVTLAEKKGKSYGKKEPRKVMKTVQLITKEKSRNCVA
jgi:hypothetical protein